MNETRPLLTLDRPRVTLPEIVVVPNRATQARGQRARRAPRKARRLRAPTAQLRPADVGAAPHAPRADTGVTRPATGLLIPALPTRIPRSINEEGEWKWIRQMAATGLLTESDLCDSAGALIELGFERLMPGGSVLWNIENEFMEEAVQIYADGETIGISCFDYANDNRLPVEPLIKRLEKLAPRLPLARWMAWLLNCHRGISGPQFWPDLAGWIPDQPLSEDELAEFADPKDAARLGTHGAIVEWLTTEKQRRPWLFHYDIKRPPMSTPCALRALRERDPKLAAICSALTAHMRRPKTISKFGEPLVCTFWDRGGVIDHGWDRISHEIHQGNIDQSQNELFSARGDIPHIVRAIADLEAFLGPVSALQKYCFRLCH